MSVRVDGSVIHLEGHCPVEDAETLLVAMQEQPDAHIDLSAATYVHMAVAQILGAVRPGLSGVPGDDFIRTLLLPALFDLSLPEQNASMEAVAPQGSSS
ncbi:MAG TPA: hypothetical protein VF475_00340 [Sphingobium sp.]